MTSKTQVTEAKIKKWDYIKQKFLHSKGNHQQNESQPTEWEKTSKNHYEGLIFKIYKELLELDHNNNNKKNQVIQILFSKGPEMHFSKSYLLRWL